MTTDSAWVWTWQMWELLPAMSPSPERWTYRHRKWTRILELGHDGEEVNIISWSGLFSGFCGTASRGVYDLRSWMKYIPVSLLFIATELIGWLFPFLIFRKFRLPFQLKTCMEGKRWNGLNRIADSTRNLTVSNTGLRRTINYMPFPPFPNPTRTGQQRLPWFMVRWCRNKRLDRILIFSPDKINLP